MVKGKNEKKGRSRVRIIIIVGCVVLFLCFLFLHLFSVFSVNKVISTDDIIHYQGSFTLKEGDSCDVDWSDVSLCIPDSFSLVNTNDSSIRAYADSSNRSIIMGFVDVSLEEEIEIHGIQAEKFMKKYQFKDFVDVLHYYEKHQKEKISIFSFPSSVKEYYVIWSLVNLFLPEGDFYYINGDYYGYLVKQKNNYVVYLYHNNGKLYSIYFANSGLSDNYFTDSKVQEILGSFRFKD